MTDLLPDPQMALSIKEVCGLVGISRTGIYREISTDRLRAFKCGRRTLIRAGDLKAWLDQLQELKL